MALEPKPGLVIRYDFLWKQEEKAGYTEGRKDRPCAIVITSKAKDDGSKDVILCPITHTPPSQSERAVEIPYEVARRLKLDHERMWIKTHQINMLTWERNHIPDGVVPAYKDQWSFGQLPIALGKQVFEQLKENRQAGSIETVRREPDLYLREKLKSMRPKATTNKEHD